MTPIQALMVNEYLQHGKSGARGPAEDSAFQAAWEIITQEAQAAIEAANRPKKKLRK